MPSLQCSLSHSWEGSSDATGGAGGGAELCGKPEGIWSGGIATRRVSFAGQEDDDEEVNTQVNEEKFKDLSTRLMREYEQGKGERDPGESNGRRDQTEPSNAIRCYRCGGRGHMSWECRKERRRCFACGEVGHMRADCPGKRGAQSSSRGQGKKGHLNWKGVDTQAVRPPLKMFSKSARKFTWTKVKSTVIPCRQGQPQVRTRKWGACQQKTLQRTGSWSSYWVNRSTWWFAWTKSWRWKMLNPQALQRHHWIVVVCRYVQMHHRIVVIHRYISLTGHRISHWQWWYWCGLDAGKWWLWWTQQRGLLSWAVRWARNFIARRLWKRYSYGMRSRTPGWMEASMNTLISSWVVGNTTGMLWRPTSETLLTSALTSWSRWNVW